MMLKQTNESISPRNYFRELKLVKGFFFLCFEGCIVEIEDVDKYCRGCIESMMR